MATQRRTRRAPRRQPEELPVDLYEKLGRFYLGGVVDAANEPERRPFLYDMNDLQTHAVCLGMTGSGKTGLAITMLEEAAIDGVPVIAIDPKGDLPNLLLSFPSLSPAEFRPWLQPGVAGADDTALSEEARRTAAQWRQGLASWGQGPERIERYANAADRVVYTPGSDAGRGLAMLRSFAAPAPAVVADAEAFRDRVVGAVSGLLSLLGIEADPLASREHVLLTSLLEASWRAGASLDLPGWIHQVQKPPIDRIGVMDLETFFPRADRFGLAMRLNGLLASPGFGAWSAGDPLDIQSLLSSESGKPRLSIVSIAHLGDAERMFVVASLVNELVAWMRTQPGSRSLRALLYMDEVYGYLPPTANPPSKGAFLTLLKQARAFGLGVVLATQNPVDLDYKALSNAGTWFLGRLSTERDKARVLDGLEGAAGRDLDRGEIDATLSALPSRSFLVRNVHEDAPVVVKTRWALSYLAGPMTREQIRRLSGSPADAASPKAPAQGPARMGEAAGERPVLPAGIAEAFEPLLLAPGAGDRVLYRPSLAAELEVHYANARLGIDRWTRLAYVAELGADTQDEPWKVGTAAESLAHLETEPEIGAGFSALPPAAHSVSSYRRWERQLKAQVYREERLQLFKSTQPKLVSLPGEDEGAFRLRLRAALRERRDAAVEKLRQRYAPKLQRIQSQIQTAEHRVERERSQYSSQQLQAAISVGATLVGALFGRKSSSVGRATTAARGAGRALRERGDIERAEEKLDALRDRLQALEQELGEDLSALEAPIVADELDLVSVPVAPRKTDLEVIRMVVAWRPWIVGPDGVAMPAISEAEIA